MLCLKWVREFHKRRPTCLAHRSGYTLVYLGIQTYLRSVGNKRSDVKGYNLRVYLLHNCEVLSCLQYLSVPNFRYCGVKLPLDKSDKLLLQLSLSPRFLKIINATEIKHNIAGFAKVYLLERAKTREEQISRRIGGHKSWRPTHTSCKRLRILISISSIILPVLVICEFWSCIGQSCSIYSDFVREVRI